MASSKQRYPLSTLNGQYIPLDVIRPSGLIKISYLEASASAAVALPAGTELLLVRSTSDCFIKFANSSATKPTNIVVADTLDLRAEEYRVVSPMDLYYSVIGDTVDGELFIQILETWMSLSLDTVNRGK
ncbi:MAG: hypothetical protein ACD_86C00004G0005 [uncultured bacterium]|nr:MAG: hypothetical protein ACD_86C00004G0005 [uncultured bacterium]